METPRAPQLPEECHRCFLEAPPARVFHTRDIPRTLYVGHCFLHPPQGSVSHRSSRVQIHAPSWALWSIANVEGPVRLWETRSSTPCVLFTNSFFIVSALESHPAVLRDDSWLCEGGSRSQWCGQDGTRTSCLQSLSSSLPASRCLYFFSLTFCGAGGESRAASRCYTPEAHWLLEKWVQAPEVVHAPQFPVTRSGSVVGARQPSALDPRPLGGCTSVRLQHSASRCRFSPGLGRHSLKAF